MGIWEGSKLRVLKALYLNISNTFEEALQTTGLDPSLLKKSMLSGLKVKCFQHNFAIFFTHFFQHWKWNAFSLISPYFSCIFFTNSENAEYFRRFKIQGITFGILWLKSQFQPDFTNIFSLGILWDQAVFPLSNKTRCFKPWLSVSTS